MPRSYRNRGAAASTARKALALVAVLPLLGTSAAGASGQEGVDGSPAKLPVVVGRVVEPGTGHFSNYLERLANGKGVRPAPLVW